MKIEIRVKGLAVDVVARERVRRRLRLALGRFASRVERASISLEELNAPQGSPDRCCRIRLTLSGGGDPVLVEDVDPDLIVAVDRASKRVGRSVTRRLDRVRTRRSSF